MNEIDASGGDAVVCTLPSLPSNNFTGHSRTDAAKQYEEGLYRDALGYHTKSTMGDGWGRVLEWVMVRGAVSKVHESYQGVNLFHGYLVGPESCGHDGQPT